MQEYRNQEWRIKDEWGHRKREKEMRNFHLPSNPPELLQGIQIDRLQPSVHGKGSDVSTTDSLGPLPDTWGNN